VSGFLAAIIGLSAIGIAFLTGTDLRGPAIGLLDAVARVAVWGLILVSCARLAARIVGSRLTGLAHVIWDGATGLAGLIVLLLVVGLVPGGFRPVSVHFVLLVVVAAAAYTVTKDPVARFRTPQHVDAPSRGVILLLLGLLLAGLAWDRVPPSFFDTRAYHFALPEMWLVNGRIAPETWSLHAWFPPGMPLLYGVGLATGGEPWANDASLLVGLLLVAGAFDLARRSFGGAAGLLAAALVTATPLILYALAIPAADLGHGLFVFGSLACLFLRSAEDPSWWKRASVLAGGALLTKYLGLIAPIAIGAVWIGLKPVSTPVSWRRRIGEAFRFAALAVLLAAPWFAANVLTVGNPVAPAASSIFPTRGLAPGGAQRFRGDARGGLPGWQDVRNLGPRWISGSEEDSRFYPTPAFGWLPLVLAPLALVAVRNDRNVRAVMGVAAVLFAVWFMTYRWERFLVAGATVLAVGIAGGIVAMARRGNALRVLPFVAALFTVLSILAPLLEIGRFNHGLRVALGLESAQEFIGGGFPSARLFRLVNERLDPGRDRILFLGEMRHYGLSVPRCAPTGFNTHPLVEALRNDPDAGTAHAAMRRLRFTHVIVDPGWIARSAAQYPSLSYLVQQPDAMAHYIGSLGTPLAVEGNVALFRIPD